MTKFINIKNGKEYDVLDLDITNATNNGDGQDMFLYRDSETGKFFVRDKNEFLEKFKLKV
ncbi:MAG: hypothetical protein ACRCX2_39125 [Paraclostridium sp.]